MSPVSNRELHDHGAVDGGLGPILANSRKAGAAVAVGTLGHALALDMGRGPIRIGQQEVIKLAIRGRDLALCVALEEVRPPLVLRQPVHAGTHRC